MYPNKREVFMYFKKPQQILTILFLLSCLLYADNVPYSQSPPGGLKPEQCPMFVCFGFDDNGYADGIKWFRELVKNKKNSDGSPVRASFFNAGKYGENYPEVLAEWKLLAQDKHEIANHTWNHATGGKTFTIQKWEEEISSTNNFFIKELGITENEIKGFRSPYLAYNVSTMEALKNNNFAYDCSIEFGFNGWSTIEGDPDWPPQSSGVWHNSMSKSRTHKKLFWPHTLDNGSPPGHSATGNPKIAGLWEIPVYTYLRYDSTGVVTGFDFNLWKNATKFQFLETLKLNFDLRLSGNRNPLTINAHTDYYSEFNEAANAEFAKANYTERKQAIEEFIDYVLTKPEVRVVPFIKLIEWMKNPTPIGQAPIINKSISIQSFENFSIKLSTAKTIEFSNLKPDVYSISVINAMGKTAKQINSLNINNKVSFKTPMPAGIYMIRISNGENSVVRKTAIVN